MLEEEKTGSVQNGYRPCVIMSNPLGLKHSPTIYVVPISTSKKRLLPFHVHIEHADMIDGTILNNSIVLCEQLRIINKEQCRKMIGLLNNMKIREIEAGLLMTLGITG
jgi:mRNA interferase MazF